MEDKRIRIESDGTAPGTKVTCGGVPISGVKSFVLHARAADHLVAVTLEVENVECDVFAEHLGSWDLRSRTAWYRTRNRWGRIKRGFTCAFGR